MVLSSEDRGFLEKIIDQQIQNIPNLVGFARNEQVKKGLMITNDYDFVIGQVFSTILGSFSSYYTQKLTNIFSLPTPDQLQTSMQEAVNVIIRRLPEIRNAIYSCG